MRYLFIDKIMKMFCNISKVCVCDQWHLQLFPIKHRFVLQQSATVVTEASFTPRYVILAQITRQCKLLHTFREQYLITSQYTLSAYLTDGLRAHVHFPRM